MSEPLALIDSWHGRQFEPFREGIEICRLVDGEPAVAFLRYAPGARVPLHRHRGLETIIVLDGEQCDERGCYPKGAVVLNPKGSQHSVWSDAGCVVLIQWERAIEFADGEA